MVVARLPGSQNIERGFRYMLEENGVRDTAAWGGGNVPPDDPTSSILSPTWPEAAQAAALAIWSVGNQLPERRVPFYLRHRASRCWAIWRSLRSEGDPAYADDHLAYDYVQYTASSVISWIESVGADLSDVDYPSAVSLHSLPHSPWEIRNVMITEWMVRSRAFTYLERRGYGAPRWLVRQRADAFRAFASEMGEKV